MKVSARTCRLWGAVVFTAGRHHEAGRLRVEQLTRVWCGWHIVEMLALLIQSATHRAADVTGHSRRSVNLRVRNARGTQECTDVILVTLRTEQSSWYEVFSRHEDCYQSREVDCHRDCHRCVTFRYSVCASYPMPRLLVLHWRCAGDKNTAVLYRTPRWR